MTCLFGGEAQFGGARLVIVAQDFFS